MDMCTLGIGTAIEIGVYTGSSSYFLSAMLTRANPELVYHMVDIADSLVAFDEFSKLVRLERHVPATSQDFTGQAFDLVFIDGDHSYEGALADLCNVGRYCRKAVAFHDIRAHEYNHLSGGTVRMWNEFRQASSREMKIVQYTHEPTPWMGLGVGIRPD